MDIVWQVAQQFSPTGQIRAVREHGNGNINDTYLVSVDAAETEKFVLQRINTHVFRHPVLISENLRTFNDHIDRKVASRGEAPSRRWDVPQVWKTKTGADYLETEDNSFWRAISFVNHSKSYDTVRSMTHAREAGYALGRFQSLLSDLDTALMHDTLPGFHITPGYLQLYDDIVARDHREDGSAGVEYCHGIIRESRGWASVLEDARARGELTMRIIHGDPKINNFMICDQTGQAVSVIDLDTVKPGLVHYDIGDCLRSSCNPLGEETTDFENVRFDIDLARAILDGYISVAQEFLTPNDYAYLYDSIRLLPFELGLRFFTDYLSGNVYFKACYEEHNLHRAIVQFELAQSVEAQEKDLRAVIHNLSVFGP